MAKILNRAAPGLDSGTLAPFPSHATRISFLARVPSLDRTLPRGPAGNEKGKTPNAKPHPHTTHHTTPSCSAAPHAIRKCHPQPRSAPQHTAHCPSLARTYTPAHRTSAPSLQLVWATDPGSTLPLLPHVKKKVPRCPAPPPPSSGGCWEGMRIPAPPLQPPRGLEEEEGWEGLRRGNPWPRVRLP